MQGDLGRFADGPREEQQGDQGDHPHLPLAARPGQQVDGRPRLPGRLAEDGRIIQGPEGQKDEQHPQAESEVSDAIDHEGLGGGVARRFLLVPMGDEQVGAKAHGLPAKEQLQEVVGHDQHQHRKGEQGHVGEEPGVSLVAVHVSDGVEIHQTADGGHQHQHGRGEGVDIQSEADPKIAADDPGVDFPVNRRSAGHLQEGDDGKNKGNRNGG